MTFPAAGIMGTEIPEMDKVYWEKEIRGNWFKDHKATLTKQGDLIVIDWRKPGTCTFAVRYVFDGRFLYVTGDIGEAVFKFSESGYLVSQDYALDYFTEKMTASSRPGYSFDSELALKDLDERIQINNDEDSESYPDDAVEQLKSIINDCSNVKEFQQRINELDLYKFGNEYYEWLPELGSTISGEVRAYLIGLKMAAMQLTKGEVTTK
jgi:hypothetical protein